MRTMFVVDLSILRKYSDLWLELDVDIQMTSTIGDVQHHIRRCVSKACINGIISGIRLPLSIPNDAQFVLIALPVLLPQTELRSTSVW